MLIFHNLWLLLFVHNLCVAHCQETTNAGPFIMHKYFILNEEMTAIAAYFVVLASHQGIARAPFHAEDHKNGVPYPFVSKYQQGTEHWLKGDHQQWNNLGLDGERNMEVGINMDWTLMDTVSHATNNCTALRVAGFFVLFWCVLADAKFFCCSCRSDCCIRISRISTTARTRTRNTKTCGRPVADRTPTSSCSPECKAV